MVDFATAGGSFGSGLLKGMLQAKMYGNQKEIEDQRIQLMKMQNEALKYQTEQSKIKNQREQRILDLMLQRFGGGQEMPSTQTGTDLGASFQQTPEPTQKQSGIVDMLSGSQDLERPTQSAQQTDGIPQLTPQDVFLGSLAGIPLGKVFDAQMKKQTLAVNRGRGIKRTGEIPGSEPGIEYSWREDPITGEVTAAPIVSSRTQPTEITNFVDGAKVTTPINPFTRQPVGGSRVTEQKKPLTAETSAKLQLAQDAIQNVSEFKKMLMPDGKTIDRQLLTTMATRLPFSSGRQAWALVHDAVEGKLRAESGAAIPDAEVSRMAKRFIPSIWDNDETIKDKIKRLDRFSYGVVEKMDPNKNYAGVMTFKDESGQEYVITPADNPDEISNDEIDKILGGK